MKWTNSAASIALMFPKNTPEAAVRDIARRIRDDIKLQLEQDGVEVFGNECPRVNRSIFFHFDGERTSLRETAGSKNDSLQKAYNVLRGQGIPFWNNPTKTGRSLRPTIGISMKMEKRLTELADKVTRRNGMPRFHFTVGK